MIEPNAHPLSSLADATPKALFSRFIPETMPRTKLEGTVST